MAAKKKAKKKTSASAASWRKGNVACRRLYSALLDRQFDISIAFKDAGNRKLKSWVYWVVGASAAVRNERADSLAHWLGGYFLNILKAKPEAGASPASAVNAMAAVLRHGNKTMSDLAKTVDVNYRFARENH